MKLATLNNGKRDGALVVVSRDLSRAVRVPQLAATLQAALDEWAELAPKLTAVYQQLNDGACADAFPFDETACLSPLPRAYQWADGSAYVNHVELVRKARGAEMPESFWHDPLMYQGGSDSFLPPRGTIPMGSEEWGIDFESEIAVITDDVPMGTSPQAAAGHIKLLMVVNDVSLRNLIPGELAKGFGFFQSKPSSSFSPLAITPDELGDDWRDGKVHLPLETYLNGALFGAPDAGVDMTFNFYELIAHAAKTRPLGAGCIIGSGTVSNYDRSRGSSCLAELRMLEIIESGQATTPFLRFGDTVSIAMQDRNGMSLFGTILQRVTPAGASQTK
ncbi:fumarylacetoacetate hydrolase family protein [Aeromonas hydrophila]|uniref:fumarylacetoacetate hydrolase family protein n=1 Tax=Aeromonas hydrophila TaxID=644 RepID=UPI00207C5688|nr:fumarylacetoacetate hydrolase family protein [Aeromonas hydrophila]MCO4212521.1 fumarylacetoacetate hydrolase family protein [Aeromonas hydrophila]HDX8444769.1 fumarylacetoacetate hydrolase family protein [Aeromonas hydrophila]HDX8633468.1 fumarylacetoacetate hydrolase family protein [Aeromonas hydrophila]